MSSNGHKFEPRHSPDSNLWQRICVCDLIAPVKADSNLVVTASNRKGTWQVFVTNLQERLVFGLRQFAGNRQAKAYAEDLAMRWSCRIETAGAG